MKILITTHHLKDYGGSELFTQDLAVALKDSGHEVFVFSPNLGLVAETIRKNGINITDNLRKFKNEKFDIIHAQHNETAISVRSVFKRTPMVFMVHGTIPKLEQPPLNLRILKFIAISEGVKRHLTGEYSIPPEKIQIVRNFIDAKRFSCKKQVNDRSENLLVLSNRYTEKIRDVIEKACEDFKIKIAHVGLPENPAENVEDHINNADIVVTHGRGALESMACERNVIVYGIYGGDGFIDETNFYELRKNNFSGRRYRKEYTPDDLKSELKKYDPDVGMELRKLVIKENSKDDTLRKLEEIYLECSN
ncbi:MAG: glycosyltransferase [Candidatus Saganbacteria bacterium]|nr:glycosyltransferase [Candidatus Saganbacteria bacterium]